MPEPGLFDQVATVAAGTGACAFGTGSGSVKGLRMSGLTGNASMACSPVQEVAPTWAAAGVGRPAMTLTAVAAPAAAPIFSTSLLLRLSPFFFMRKFALRAARGWERFFGRFAESPLRGLM